MWSSPWRSTSQSRSSAARSSSPSATEGGHDRIGDAGAGRTGAEDDDPLVGELGPGDPAGGHDDGQGDGGGPLDVVVERAEAVAVAVEQPVGVGQGEVLPLEQHAGQGAVHRLDERLDEVVVGLAPQPLVPPAEVERVGQVLGVVGAGVEVDRKRPRGVDAAAERVERELADRDAHAPDAQVAQAEDPLAVGHDDHVHRGERPVRQDRVDLVAVLVRQEQAARFAVDPAEVAHAAPTTGV